MDCRVKLGNDAEFDQTGWALMTKTKKPEALLAELKGRLREISDLAGTSAILSWDQSTYMPTGGAVARGRQCALMSRLLHERRTDAGLGRLIEQLTPYADGL